MIKNAIRALASLRLSIALLVLALMLVYIGTWAQVDAGIYEVQKRYFHSWLTWANLGTVLPRTADGQLAVSGGFPMPGGYTIGLLMLLNLLASWYQRFAWAWNKIGLHLVHLGLVVLLLGEAWTSVAQIDARMMIRQGEAAAYTEDSRRIELALIEKSTTKERDPVWSIRQDMLYTGSVIGNAGMPVTLQVDEFAPNSELLGPMQAGASAKAQATAGAGVGITMRPLRKEGTVSSGSDSPSAYVTVLEKGQSRGTFLLSFYQPLDAAQEVTLGDGTKLHLQLRPKRYALPYEVKLVEFRNDRYPGTNIPKNYSSRVRVIDAGQNVDREEVIWMNHPLRYGGQTFYQSGFVGEDTTILQVVRNPAMFMPYAACIIGSIGLLLQFGIAIWGFATTRRTTRTVARTGGRMSEPAGWAGVAVPAGMGLLCAFYLLGQYKAAEVAPDDIAQAPVYYEGRLQPLDSLARNSLRAMAGRDETVNAEGSTVTSMQWLLDALCRPEQALHYPILRIDNPQVQAILNLDTKQKRFSFEDVRPKMEELERQAQRATDTEANHRDVVDRKILELYQKVALYTRVSQWSELFLMPPATGQGAWRPLGPALHQGETGAKAEPLAETIAGALGDYRAKPSLERTDSVAQWIGAMQQQRPADMAKTRLEVFYNRYQPFLQAMVLYIIVFVLACGSMLIWQRPLWRSAMAVMVLGFAVQTLAIWARIYLMGRPPVTNLYSSAVFIGWGAVLLAIFFEYFFRNGIMMGMASLVGTATLIIAQNLAQGGDTMASLQAVLDSNFWLTTHVLAITYGYSAVFVAGGLGIAYVLGNLLSASFAENGGRTLGRMIYGIACFALLFSFVGTILGGIWADQSWGRFWGWDPKENGAILIVIWVAIMLHARWVGGGDRALALMAIFGNIVTAWSWFGTNMLGVGLHSYGFMDSALVWLLIFVGSQLLLIGLGWLPIRISTQSPKPQAVATGSE